jgi:hypothetical protein
MKKSPKVLPNPFLSKLLYITCVVWKNSPRVYATSVSKNLPKEDTRPMGENSPNLVTLTCPPHVLHLPSEENRPGVFQGRKNVRFILCAKRMRFP